MPDCSIVTDVINKWPFAVNAIEAISIVYLVHPKHVLRHNVEQAAVIKIRIKVSSIMRNDSSVTENVSKTKQRK